VPAEFAVTVKVTLLLAPKAVVTLTVRAAWVAVAEIVNVVVSCVPAALTVMAPTVIPPPETLTAVAPKRPAPVSVTGRTVSPLTPVAGEIDVSDGGMGATEPNSAAPGSKVVGVVGPGLMFPKKSVLGTRLKFASVMGIESIAGAAAVNE